MKSALVTGGAGFVGKHLVRQLIQEGFEVEVIDIEPRPPASAGLPVSRKLRYFQGDVNGPLMRFRSSPRTKIVHLAASTSVQDSVRQPLRTVRANIETTCRMLDLARKLDSDRFVFASTAAIYGDRDSSCRESDAPAPASPYASSKLASEYYCKVYASLYGIPTVILRYFNIYGPGQSNQYAGVITRFVKEALKGNPPTIFGYGTQTRDFVFIDDVIRATLTSLTKRLSGGTVLNIGTGRATTILSLARQILRFFSQDNLRPLHAPRRPGDVQHSQADISEARKKILFHPRYQLERGLPPTIKWLRAVRNNS